MQCYVTHLYPPPELLASSGGKWLGHEGNAPIHATPAEAFRLVGYSHKICHQNFWEYKIGNRWCTFAPTLVKILASELFALRGANRLCHENSIPIPATLANALVDVIYLLKF